MKRFQVKLCIPYLYEVEAENDDSAKEKALEEWEADSTFFVGYPEIVDVSEIRQ